MEVRIVLAPAARLADDADHVVGALGIVRREPFLEKRAYLVRQAQQDPARPGRPRLCPCFEDMLERLVGQCRDDGRDQHSGRDAGRRERADRVQSARRAGRARLELARERRIQGRDRDESLDQVLAGHRRQQVDVALDQRRLGDDGERMVALGEHLDQSARDAVAAFDRLVAVGIGAESERRDAIAGARELVLQQLDRVGLGEELGLEIEARRELEIGVGRSRVAVDAAVLAAAIGIHRLVERNVGRIVARDDRARAFLDHRRLELRLRLLLGRPAVVEGRALGPLEAALDL